MSLSLTLSQKLEVLNQARLDNLPSYRITVLRNVMIEPLADPLRYAIYEECHNALLSFGEFDMIYQEAAGGRPDLLNKDTRCVLVFMYLPQESPGIAHGFAAMTPQAVRDEIERILEKVSSVVAGIRRQTTGMILWHGFEFPTAPGLGIYDSQSEAGQLAAVHRLNAGIGKILKGTKSAYLVDTNLCLMRIGSQRFYDWRYWHRGRLPYTLDGIDAIVEEELKFLRPSMGRTRKCLVLDCDNTLWGGIVGEDGISGIELGATHPGSMYHEFQKEVLNLHHRGVILALCSRNNEADVWEVFDKHPYMVLRREHIATVQINWLDKIVNLRQIAMDLNIGLNCLVFADDNPFEVNLVRQTLAEVDVLHLPRETAFRAREILAGYGKFDTLAVSEEDRKRGAMYQADGKRKRLRSDSINLSSYYRSLGMEVSIRLADAFAIPRIAQQTQKTNQFNLTTRRYAEADIERFMNRADYDVLSLSLSDCFGDSGLVGTCIIRYGESDAIIDTLLLSCRVLGRELENVFLFHAVKRAKQRGANRVLGDYVKTRKNEQVEHFYSKHDFAEVKPREGMDRSFVFDLNRTIPGDPDYFKSITSII